MPRISIKPHHTQFLQLIASQMGCDQTEALNHLLWHLREMNFSFSSPLSSFPSMETSASMATAATPAPTAPTPPRPPQPQHVYAFTQFEEITPANKLGDEVIERLAGLLEEF